MNAGEKKKRKKRGADLVALASGAESEAHDPGDGAREIPTIRPWVVYDRFLKGEALIEIAMPLGLDSQEVKNDIEDMREHYRAQYPQSALADLEVDELRRNDLLIRSGFVDGSAQGLKVVAEAQERNRLIILAGERRKKAEAGREEILK